MKYFKKTVDLDGKTLILEIGAIAPQATASVMARLGDTMILSTVVMGRENPNLDYFPLSVEYIERLYAGGRIKGSRWVKREGRPSDDAILKARLIDRSIRPLFPKDFKKEVQVVVTVLSVDGENNPDIPAIIATSCALACSRIPWSGPIGATRVGVIKTNGDKNFVANPEEPESDMFDLDMIISGTAERAVMIEAGANQVKEDTLLEAVAYSFDINGKIIKAIEEIVKEVGEKKETVPLDENWQALVSLVEKSYKDEIEKLIRQGVNKEVGSALDGLTDRICQLEDNETLDKAKVKKAVDYVFKKTVRELILKENRRPDGRACDEVRQITVKTSVLPRTHGSAIFQRGETQVLTVVTLGTSSLEQLIESPEGEESKRYMHHYSMPPYSVGETGRIGTPSRREIGHGALAERALLSVIPKSPAFPYTIRVVSEVMSSNGSTSMASTCGSTLALMDAGVPIESPVAGIAMGLMTNGTKNVVLTDIMGLEDFSGDMDFKVAGTKDGVTAIQLDVKSSGLTMDIIKETFAGANKARLFILDKMLSVISAAKKEVSQFAPKIKVIKIDTGKIGEVIGSGGKTIRNIIASTGAQVDVSDDGSVNISSQDEKSVEKAVAWIDILTRELVPNETFEGKVKRLLPFGAMVEIVPGKEGMVHISEVSTEYVNNLSDVLKIGQTVKVRVKEVDDQGRINLSMLFGEQERNKSNPQREERRSFPQRQGRREGFNKRRSY